MKPSRSKKRGKPQVTALIATLNEEKKLGGLLKNLLSNPSPPELLVIDGGSRDRTLEIARQYGARVIHQKTRGGPSEAWNMGARAAKTPFMVIMGGDFRGVNKEFFTASLPYFKDPKVVVVYTDYTFAPIDTFFESLYLRSQYFHYPNYEGPFRNPLSYTCIMRRSVYNAIGGLGRFGVGEDIEFEERLQKYLKKNGMRVHYEPRCVQLSNVPETWNEFVKSALWYGRTSVTYFKRTKSLRFFRPPAFFASFASLLAAPLAPFPASALLALFGVPAALLFLWFAYAAASKRDAWYLPAYFLRMIQGGLYWLGMAQSFWFKGLGRG